MTTRVTKGALVSRLSQLRPSLNLKKNRDWAYEQALHLGASHADVLRGSSRVPAPQTSADLSGKNVDQSQQTSRSGKCTLDLEKFRAWLYSSRKDQKGLMKGEDLTVLEQTTHLTQKRSYSRLPSKSHWKKITSGVKFAKQKSALLQNNKVWKKILPFVQLQGNPAVASPCEQLCQH